MKRVRLPRSKKKQDLLVAGYKYHIEQEKKEVDNQVLLLAACYGPAALKDAIKEWRKENNIQDPDVRPEVQGSDLQGSPVHHQH
jgi:hypothetical protein